MFKFWKGNCIYTIIDKMLWDKKSTNYYQVLWWGFLADDKEFNEIVNVLCTEIACSKVKKIGEIEKICTENEEKLKKMFTEKEIEKFRKACPGKGCYKTIKSIGEIRVAKRD